MGLFRVVRLLSAGAFGYLLGTTPSADLAARIASGGRADLRTTGSGNPGAYNAMQLLGKGWGYGVMAGDIVKAALACRIGLQLAADAGTHVGGTAAVVGHCFPVWNGFRGGKGVAASVGQCLATFPAYFPIDLAVAGLTATGSWRRRAFAATAAASGAWVVGGVLWWRHHWPNLWGPRPSGLLPASAAATSAVILYKFAAARPPQ